MATEKELIAANLKAAIILEEAKAEACKSFPLNTNISYIQREIHLNTAKILKTKFNKLIKEHGKIS